MNVWVRVTIRRSSLFNTERIDHLYEHPQKKDRRFVLHHGDMTDASSLIRTGLGVSREVGRVPLAFNREYFR